MRSQPERRTSGSWMYHLLCTLQIILKLGANLTLLASYNCGSQSTTNFRGFITPILRALIHAIISLRQSSTAAFIWSNLTTKKIAILDHATLKNTIYNIDVNSITVIAMLGHEYCSLRGLPIIVTTVNFAIYTAVQTLP